MIRSLISRFGVLVLAISLFVPAALAQGQQGQQAQDPPPEVDVSEDELDDVAELVVQIEEVRAEYRKELQGTQDAEKAQSIQQEMSSEIEGTIEDFEGISVDRYDKIMRAAQADNELRDQIMSRIEELREEREEEEG